MSRTTLVPGETIVGDRAYAIENGPGRFDPANPKPLAKTNFLMLMRNERLATLHTVFDDPSQTLTVLRAGKQVAKGNLTTRIGRQMIEQFLAAYLKTDLRGPPHIVQAPGHAFTDVAVKCLHVVNLASIRELERIMGRPVDPLRFRANLYVDGLPAWSERQMLGQSLRVGPCELRVIDRTVRCAATNVDPATAARDTDIPAVLQRTWGHSDFGVYATVVTGGDIACGNDISSIV